MVCRYTAQLVNNFRQYTEQVEELVTMARIVCVCVCVLSLWLF